MNTGIGSKVWDAITHSKGDYSISIGQPKISDEEKELRAKLAEKEKHQILKFKEWKKQKDEKYWSQFKPSGIHQRVDYSQVVGVSSEKKMFNMDDGENN